MANFQHSITASKSKRRSGVAIYMSDDFTATRETLIALTSDIVAAHVSNNSVAVGDLPTLISNVYGALAGLDRNCSGGWQKMVAR